MVTLRFDACAAINAYHSARERLWFPQMGTKLHKRAYLPENPLEKEESVILGIHEKGLNSGVSIQIQGKIQNCSSQPVYQTFYDILSDSVPEILKKTKNLFLPLVENVAHFLNVTSCYVCGRTTLGDWWPWAARELVSSDPVPDLTSVQKIQTNGFGVLKVSIIGQHSLKRRKRLHCSRCLETFWALKRLDGPGWGCTGYVDIEHMYNCLNDGQAGELLGYPDYSAWEKRNLKIGEWKDDEWPQERIIEYYGPATWAVFEILTNETGKALSILAQEETQMRNAIYQNQLALDYLLAPKEDCGKFNLTNCCLQVDDQGPAVEDIVRDINSYWYMCLCRYGADLNLSPCLEFLQMIRGFMAAVVNQRTTSQLYY
ncbi:Endogenous retrovirus group 3 member 1 Env polyprotein, partial [Plecturocebus cupreus]